MTLSFVFAVAFVSQGVIQNLDGFTEVTTVEGAEATQAIPGGPVASQIAIKQLGTNGGGFFNTNSSHPLENPTLFNNFLETYAIAVIPVDLAAKRVTTGEGEVRLTPTEWGLVETLVRNTGKLVAQKQLLQEVWGPQYGDETNYLRVHMAHIRRKLEPEPSRPRYFLTEPGMGYRFVS